MTGGSACDNCVQYGNGCYITADVTMTANDGINFCAKSGGSLPFFPTANEWQDFLGFV